MTQEEIFGKVLDHMMEGITFHHELVCAYDFLGLYGFAKCHEYHYFAENKGFESLLHYYSTRYHKLIHVNFNQQENIIPETWYKYTTMAVDAGTKRQAIKTMMEKWVQWERDTKALYQKMYKELLNIDEVASANMLNELICDVDEELKHAEKKLIKLETIGYDIGNIVGWQDHMYNKFSKELKCLF